MVVFIGYKKSRLLYVLSIGHILTDGRNQKILVLKLTSEDLSYIIFNDTYLFIRCVFGLIVLQIG